MFYFFAALLLAPYVVLLTKISQFQLPDLAELWWATKNSFLQAGLSAIGSLLLGAILANGSIFIDQKMPRFRKLSELLCVLPSILPPIFILLTVVSVLQPFVIGLHGVAFIHILMNAGLVALLLKSLVENKLQNYLELASVAGSSRWHFLKNSWGLVQKDILNILFFVFVLCFCSFAVPIMVGGGKATTIEILIYEKIRISGAWGEALALALIQMLIVLGFSYFQKNERALNEAGRFQRVPLLGGKFSALIFVLYCTSFALIFFWQIFLGWPQLLAIPGLWERALETLPMSLLLSISVGVLIMLLLLLAAFASPQKKLTNLLNGLVSPSTALLGFALLFFFNNEEPWIYLKFVLGFALLIFTTLYRWGWNQELTGLEKQIETASALGSSKWMTFSEITFPQVIAPAARLSAIGALWALGDFSLGKILIAKDVTLALLIETLMSSYRIEAAMALMGLLTLLGFLVYFIFWGMAYVAHRKSQ